MLSTSVDKSKLIYFGVRTWAKAFAWIQIVLNAAASVLAILAIKLQWSTPLRYRYFVDAVVHLLGLNTFILDWFAGLIYIIGLHMFVIGTVFGVILLQGTINNYTVYLKRWTVYGVVAIVLYLNVLVSAVMMDSWSYMSLSVVSLVIYGISVWIVHKLNGELKNLELCEGIQENENNRKLNKLSAIHVLK